MSTVNRAFEEKPAVSPLDHRLAPFLPRLRSFASTRQMESSPLYRKIEAEIRRILETTVQENSAPAPAAAHSSMRAVGWNIERGVRLDGILKALSFHPDLKNSDILLLTEVDHGMARTNNLFIAREIASVLRMNFAFSPCYLALDKGSGLEAQTSGENTVALHGNALFSRYLIREAHSVALPNGKDLMRGREKRIGCQRAVVAVIEHPLGPLRAVSLHLDAHSSQRHRRDQMRILLNHVEKLRPELPLLIGGDWNTSTYNSRRAAYSILGYARRVLMGVHNVLENHYPYPDRWFERHLFRELTRRGYEYRNLNQPGGCTLHYSVEDLAANGRMADWIPNWCFWFINWALQKNGGRCSMKLDWFAGKGIVPDANYAPRVVSDVHSHDDLLSDHDPIVLRFRLAEW